MPWQARGIANGGTPSGGGIAAPSLITLNASDVTSNTAAEFGGGIFNIGDAGGISTVTFANTTGGTSISKNTAAEGGGIYNDGPTATVQFTDSSTRVTKNTATNANGGGGIFNTGGGTLIGAVSPPSPGANVKNNTPDNVIG
jgi:hypothetical protein